MLPDRIRTLEDVERLLATTTNYEERMPRTDIPRAFDLSRMRALLAALSDPQRGPVTVHVTGSKGKGSTCLMVDAILRAMDRGPVGLYVSPHLERLTERVSVDGRPVSGEELAQATEALLPHLRATLGTPAFPTFFEILTAAAHVAFRARGVRSLVLEVGLGGRLDATTVCDPAVTAITSVELEHTQVLGATLELVAGEKAGILKPGVPCVTALPLDGPALRVVEARARELNVPLLRLGHDVLLDEVEARPGPVLSLRVRGPDYDGSGLRCTLPVAGAHQAQNAAVAVAIARTLDVPDAAIFAGLEQVTLPGRMEVVLRDPTVIVDGAHTPASAEAARRAVLACFPGQRVHLVIGVLEEKDVRGILAPLLPLAFRVVVSGVPSPRAMPPARLAAIVRETFPGDVLVAATPAEALALAREGAAAEDLVLVTGSTYLCGAARAAARAFPGFLGGPPPPG